MGDITIMNQMNLALSGIGKYDWSYGIDSFSTILAASNFPWISSNLDLTPIRDMMTTDMEYPLKIGIAAEDCSKEASALVKSCYVSTETLGRVGFVGISSEDLFSMIPPSMGMDMENIEMDANATMTSTMARQAMPLTEEFINATLKQVQEQITLLETTANTNIIVLLDNASPDTATVSSMVHQLSGVDIVLATALEDMGGSLVSALPDPVQMFSALRSEDNVLDMGTDEDDVAGYPMVTTDSQDNTVLIVGPVGDNWRYIGNLMVEFDNDGNVLTWDGARTGPVAVTQENVAAMNDAEPSQAVVATLNTMQATPTITNAFSTMVGTTEFPLNGNWMDVRTQNTNLGYTVADAYLWAGRNQSIAVDGAIINSGSIFGTSKKTEKRKILYIVQCESQFSPLKCLVGTTFNDIILTNFPFFILL